MRKTRFDPWLTLSLILLAGFGVLGTVDGLSQWNEARTRLQFLATLTETCSGLFALIAIPALLTGWRGLRVLLYFWLAFLALTGGLVTVVSRGGIGEGIAALILAGVIGLGVIWVVRRAALAL